MLPGEDAFRFRHLLIRDAAYDGLPKSAAPSSTSGLRLARGAGPDLVELDEVLGYHLEQSCRYRDELGLPQEEVSERPRPAPRRRSGKGGGPRRLLAARPSSSAR